MRSRCKMRKKEPRSRCEMTSSYCETGVYMREGVERHQQGSKSVNLTRLKVS